MPFAAQTKLMAFPRSPPARRILCGDPYRAGQVDADVPRQTDQLSADKIRRSATASIFTLSLSLTPLGSSTSIRPGANARGGGAFFSQQRLPAARRGHHLNRHPPSEIAAAELLTSRTNCPVQIPCAPVNPRPGMILAPPPGPRSAASLPCSRRYAWKHQKEPHNQTPDYSGAHSQPQHRPTSRLSAVKQRIKGRHREALQGGTQMMVAVPSALYVLKAEL